MVPEPGWRLREASSCCPWGGWGMGHSSTLPSRVLGLAPLAPGRHRSVLWARESKLCVPEPTIWAIVLALSRAPGPCPGPRKEWTRGPVHPWSPGSCGRADGPQGAHVPPQSLGVPVPLRCSRGLGIDTAPRGCSWEGSGCGRGQPQDRVPPSLPPLGAGPAVSASWQMVPASMHLPVLADPRVGTDSLRLGISLHHWGHLQRAAPGPGGPR